MTVTTFFQWVRTCIDWARQQFQIAESMFKP